MARVLLSLFDRSGVWSKPWRDAGWEVIQADLQGNPPIDVMELAEHPEVLPRVDALLAAPPCTAFTVANNRNWAKYDAGHGGPAKNESTAGYVALVYAVLVLVEELKPRVWGMENPVMGRLLSLVPELQSVPVWRFDPWQYAGWADDPASEAHSKGTRIWGNAKRPVEKPVDPKIYGGEAGGLSSQSMISRVPPGGRGGVSRANLRAQTPQGFARAFFEANRGKD